jgi:hypothetical protein
LISGRGFAADTLRAEPARVVDIAPTILSHLDLDWSDVDGRPL